MSENGRRIGARTAAAAALLVLAGCGGTPPVSPEAGVDGLEIPTPDPDPYDFTAEVDHPLFPLDDGAQWVYEGEDGSSVELSVDGTDLVDGVEVTTVRRELLDDRGRTVGARRSSFAQDRDGNVWSFGRQVLDGPGKSWEAGTDGAEAGLLLPARPRVGDAWLQQESDALTTTVEVLELDARVEALGGRVEAVSTRDRATGADIDEDVVRYYAPGLGIVRVEDAVTGEPLLELVERETPSSR